MQPTLLGFCVLYVAECVTALFYVKYFVLQGVSPAACICRLVTGFPSSTFLNLLTARH